MRCKLRKSVKRVVSAGVNAEGSVEASWLRAQEEEVFGARSGADGQKAADRGGTVSRCGVKHGTLPSNVFINGSQSPFCTIVSRHGISSMCREE